MTAPEGETAGRAWTPDRVWLRVAGGGVTMPSGHLYTTMVGDDREHPRYVEYVRAAQSRQTIEALVGALGLVDDLWTKDAGLGFEEEMSFSSPVGIVWEKVRSALLLAGEKNNG